VEGSSSVREVFWGLQKAPATFWHPLKAHEDGIQFFDFAAFRLARRLLTFISSIFDREAEGAWVLAIEGFAHCLDYGALLGIFDQHSGPGDALEKGQRHPQSHADAESSHSLHELAQPVGVHGRSHGLSLIMLLGTEFSFIWQY
jgi:hypothetical protein